MSVITGCCQDAAQHLIGSESNKVESPEIGDSTFVISDGESVGIGLRALICARQIAAKVEHLQDGLDDNTQGG